MRVKLYEGHVLLWCGLLCLVWNSEATDISEESLTLKVPNDDQLYAVFNFSIVSENHGNLGGHHYRLFPRNIGDLVQKYNVAEFHLSMSQGLWRYEAWGYPYFPAPPGAQLWVWFHPRTKDVDADWRGFANALSGLLCASLNFIGKTETVTPVLSFRPEGVVSELRPDLVRHAVLPRETLCTENLTPWLKLLPCGSNAGISSLFNPATLHHSRYLSLELVYKSSCYEGDCSRLSMHLSQSVSVVFDLRKSTKMKPDFTLGNILSRKMKGACPLSRSSVIKLSVPNTVDLSPPPVRVEALFHIYDLHQEPSLRDIMAVWKGHVPKSNLVSPPLVAHCHLTGVGQQDGGTGCHLTNTAEKDIDVIVMQTVPWFLQVYLHTLKITDQTGRTIPKRLLTFQPAKTRESPHFIEFLITVPASSTAVITMQFTRGFLTWTEHPPDANHGFYIGSTVITVRQRDISMATDSENVHRIYTEAIQVIIPVPDFSMPYNVICLACTVVAIAFGSLHNLTTRIYQKLDPDERNRGLKDKILKFISWFRKDKSTTDT